MKSGANGIYSRVGSSRSEGKIGVIKMMTGKIVTVDGGVAKLPEKQQLDEDVMQLGMTNNDANFVEMIAAETVEIVVEMYIGAKLCKKKS